MRILTTTYPPPLIDLNHLHERITPSHLQISSSQGYNKQQLHGRIQNPTLKRILIIDDDDDIPARRINHC